MTDRLPVDSAECRRHAEDSLDESPDSAAVWALLAVAAELAEIRRHLKHMRGK